MVNTLTEAEEQSFFDNGYIIEVEEIVKKHSKLKSIVNNELEEVSSSESVIYNIYTDSHSPLFLGIESKDELIDSIKRLIA